MVCEKVPQAMDAFNNAYFYLGKLTQNMSERSQAWYTWEQVST